MNQVKQAFFRLYRTWRESKPKSTIVSQLRISLKCLNDRIIYHYNTTLSEITYLCQRLRSDHQPAHSQKPQSVNLSGGLRLTHDRAPSRNASKLSLDEKVLLFQLEKAEREAKQAKYNARILKEMGCPTFKRRSIEQGQKLSTRSPTSSFCKPQTALYARKAHALSFLSELAEDNRKRRMELEEREKQQLVRREEELRLAILKVYDDRHKLVSPRPLRHLTEEPRLDGQREAEHRRKNWLAKMPRTMDGALFAYGCGKRRVYDWKKEWEKRRTPSLYWKRKRKRVFSFTASLDERKRKRRKTG